MNGKRSNGVIVGGVIVAMLGAVLVFAVTGRVGAGAGVSGGAATAFVATSDIPAGTRWEDAVGAMKKREVPEDARPTTAVTTTSQLNGSSTTRTIVKGETITTGQFNTSSSGGLDIPAGHNALTINLGIPQGVARYVQAGAETNLYVTYSSLPTENNPADQTVTKLLLSNVKVLANRPMPVVTEQSDVAAAGGEILLTLALTPQQSEQVIFAKENGSVWVGLVNPGDEPVSSEGRTYRTALV